MLLQDSAIERIQANGDVVTIARLSASLQAEWLDCLAYFRARGEPVNMRPWDLNTISFQAWDDVSTIEKKMKAAVCKQIFRFAAHKAVAKASSPAASRYAVVRGSMAWRALAFFELCDTKPIILTAADAGELQQHGREFCRCMRTCVSGQIRAGARRTACAQNYITLLRWSRSFRSPGRIPGAKIFSMLSLT